MATTDELRYIQAFSRIIGVKEDDAIEYAERKGLNALVDNATQLLSTPVQREKHQAFLDLYRMSSTINTRNPIINSPEKASTYFHSVMDEIYDKEAFVVAFLNTKNRVIDHEVVSVGTINSSIVHPREVFRNAIINKANSVILCHNHPSGDLTPSTEDINITKRLKETGNLLGIKVLDHLIINGINQNEVFSFQAKGVLETAGVYDITMPQSVKEQSNYIPEQNYLENAEKSVEQNYNQIDGIINNGATVEELEDVVKAGGRISLLDLANAVQAEKKEKKNSVVEKLKTKPLKEKEKQKKAPQIGAEMER